MALKIDNDIVHATVTETIMQNTAMFETGTNGAIRVATEAIMGDLQATSIIKEISSLIGRRDIGVDTDATVKAIDSRDENNIKMYWGTGSIEFKMVDATRYGSDSSAFSAAIGEQIGAGIVAYMLNQAIGAVKGAISATAGAITGTGVATVTHALLNTALKPFGDARESIVCWVMKGTTYADLVGAGLGVVTDNVAGGVIANGSVGTLGRPVYMTDSAGLNMTTGVAILGLTADAIVATETATRQLISDTVTGKENIKMRIQGEGEFLLNVKGYSWKTASGVNPTPTAIGTAANWEQKASDIKSTAGVILNVA